jgi:hypothetical protein
VDVTIDEEAENPEMYFFVEWNGGSCYTSAEPVAAGADQTFEVLFGCEIPSSPTQVNIVAVIVYDGSTEVESEPEQVVN